MQIQERLYACGGRGGCGGSKGKSKGSSSTTKGKSKGSSTVKINRPRGWK